MNDLVDTRSFEPKLNLQFLLSLIPSKIKYSRLVDSHILDGNEYDKSKQLRAAIKALRLGACSNSLGKVPVTTTSLINYEKLCSVETVETIVSSLKT